MLKSKKLNFTKKDISKLIQLKIGLSYLYTEKITDDLIESLKDLIKLKNFNIKNFGIFKIKNKNERVGRNPKSNIKYKITARKSLSFIASKKLNDKVNS